MKVLLIGSFGHNNLGDDLLYIAINNFIKKSNPEKINCFTYSNSINLLNKIFNFKNIEIHVLSSMSFLKKIISKYKIIKYIVLSDVIIIGPGGLFPKGYNITYMLCGIIGNLLGKKVYLIGVGIPNKIKYHTLWRMFIKGCNNIIVRDKSSFNTLSKYNSNVKEAKDLAFSLDYKNMRNENISIGEKYVVWALANPKNELTMDRYGKFINDLIIIKEKVEKKFTKDIKHVFISFYKESDEVIINDFLSKANFNNYEVIKYEDSSDLEYILQIFKESMFNVAMRYHSVVLSILNSITFISISYSPKSQELIREIGLDEISVKFGITKDMYFFDEVDIDRERLINSLDYLLENTDEIRLRISSSLNKIKEINNNMYNLNV